MIKLNEIRGKKKVVLTFGRMNPPTKGHQKLIEKVLEVARHEGATPRIYLSQTQDPRKNPLSQRQKIKYLKLGIPAAAPYIKSDPKANNPFSALKLLEEEGFTDVIMVVGDDRVRSFQASVKPYINHPDKSVSLKFSSFKVVSAGARDPDAEGVEGMSATKMREAAKNGNFRLFFSGVPSGLSQRFAREMYDLVRKGLHLAEEIIKLRNTLNIPRNKMPQIKREDIKEFIRELEKRGIGISKKELSVSTLKATQKEVNSEKIKKKQEDILSGDIEIKPFIVSLDNHILDGHHQLFALKEIDKNRKVLSYVVGLKMEDLLKIANHFPKTSYKSIQE